MSWRVTVRAGSRVEHLRFGHLSAALDAIEARGREVERTAPRDAVDLKIRSFQPVQQVAARLELAGPQRLMPTVRAGIDIRGDGSAEAYLGRVRRTLVEQNRRETPYDALRRAVSQRPTG